MQIRKLGRDLQFEIILVNFTSPPPAEIIIEFFLWLEGVGEGGGGPGGEGRIFQKIPSFPKHRNSLSLAELCF